MNIYSRKLPLIYKLVQECTGIGRLVYQIGYVTFYEIKGNEFRKFYGSSDNKLKQMMLMAELADCFLPTSEIVKNAPI